MKIITFYMKSGHKIVTKAKNIEFKYQDNEVVSVRLINSVPYRGAYLLIGALDMSQIEAITYRKTWL